MLSTPFAAGSPNWIDLGTPDRDGANAFYRGLFDWEFESAGEEFGGYGTYALDGKKTGAVMQVEQAQAAWGVYFQVPDSEVTVETVEQAGGTLEFGPQDVGTLGRMTGFRDPMGARFATWEPRDHPGLDAINEPNAFCWAELCTSDVPAAAGFYRKVFGWEINSAPYPGGTYTMAAPAGAGHEANFAGFVQVGADAAKYWLPYFEVDDADAAVAKVRQLGGTVVMEPADLAGVGRIARAADPSGAPFSLIKSAMAAA
ncbi:VOC family protein [Streptomyces sp. NPDC051322]|uniref:VOC family protein n=1 Tax=Streptomyces sp. NPDC051322 TaxID=3154645 RepID=UPI0034500C6A